MYIIMKTKLYLNYFSLAVLAKLSSNNTFLLYDSTFVTIGVHTPVHVLVHASRQNTHTYNTHRRSHCVCIYIHTGRQAHTHLSHTNHITEHT